jgi:hypothetical protein
MEHVYLTKKEVVTAYDKKCITRQERDELIKRVQPNSSFNRKNKSKK